MAEIILGQQGEEIRPAYVYAENMHLSYQDIFAKQVAYRKRFTDIDFSENRDGYLLPLAICDQELKRAEAQLTQEGETVDYAKMVSVGSSENAGFEISVNGRRFSIPRDQFTPHPCRDLVNIESAVVTVKDWTRWPIYPRYEITPKISDALLDIATEPLLDDMRDLGVFLQLGDKMPFSKRNLLKKEVFERVLNKFGVDDIEEVKKIVGSIGLKIVDTSDRFSKVLSIDSDPDNSEHDQLRADVLKMWGLKAILISSRNFEQTYGMNGRTEVDALLEAIHKTV